MCTSIEKHICKDLKVGSTYERQQWFSLHSERLFPAPSAFTTGQTTDHPPQGSTVEEEVERL